MEVKVAMLRSGVSQAEFARILGCAKSTLSARLTGKKAFTVDELLRICVQLGLDLVDLFPASRVPPRKGGLAADSGGSAASSSLPEQ